MPVCKVIHASGDLSEEEVIEQLQIGRGKYLHYMGLIAEAVTTFLLGDGTVSQLGQSHDMLRALITATDMDAATDLFQRTMERAADFEEFHFAGRLWRLAKEIEPEPSFATMSQARAGFLEDNLRQYEELMGVYQEVRRIAHVGQKQEMMRRLLDDELLSGPQSAHSHRAIYYYLKLRASVLVHTRQHAAALELQAVLVGHLEAYPWISEIEGLALVQELGHLANSHYLTGDHPGYHALAQRILGLGFSNHKVERHRIRFLYPYSISIAMESGNPEATSAAIAGFLQLLEQSSTLLDRQFITQCLYACLVGAIAMQDPGHRRKVIRLLAGYRKAEFTADYYVMYRLAEVIHAFEEGDYDDVRRLVTNRNKRQKEEEEAIPKASEALRFLAYLATLMEPLPAGHRLVLPAELRQLLSAQVNGTILSGYFDLEAWVLSRERGCTMLDIFRDRASSSPEDS
ncbi:MAG: hypothetical protein U0176_05325 [Bacteroidia bacterium]